MWSMHVDQAQSRATLGLSNMRANSFWRAGQAGTSQVSAGAHFKTHPSVHPNALKIDRYQFACFDQTTVPAMC